MALQVGGRARGRQVQGEYLPPSLEGRSPTGPGWGAWCTLRPLLGGMCRGNCLPLVVFSGMRFYSLID